MIAEVHLFIWRRFSFTRTRRNKYNGNLKADNCIVCCTASFCRSPHWVFAMNSQPFDQGARQVLHRWWSGRWYGIVSLFTLRRQGHEITSIVAHWLFLPKDNKVQLKTRADMKKPFDASLSQHIGYEYKYPTRNDSCKRALKKGFLPTVPNG